MPKYLFTGSYTVEGVRGLKSGGGSARRKAIEEVVQSVGGTLESVYFAFGDNDFFITADLPDAASAAAISLTVNGSGAVHSKTIVLITPEEMDQAAQKNVTYRPPGT